MPKEPLDEIAAPLQLRRLGDPGRTARCALGEDVFEAAYQAGRAMSLDEIVGDSRP